MENDDVRTEDLPDDLTPFITRTTLYPVSGGGFGDVWKCNYDDANGISALVAVKVFKLPDRYDLEKINRKISREIGILKILRHNNIVPLLGIATGFGPMSELRCLVSPWMPNGTLNAYLASNHNVLTILDRSRMLEDISAGLCYLHSVSVMHGDITGANILIDKGGHARLIDFGLSTITQPLLGQSHLAATSIRPGAIRYAAPELVLSDDVRDLGSVEKTDIYSFGCVMLQILSGRPPWSEIKSERPEFRIVVMITEGRGPQRPDGYPTIIDSDWNFVQKCLQVEPELRPSADKVLDFVLHRFHSPDSCSRPPDDPPDDAPDDLPGASPHGGSDDSDTAEQPPDSPPLHPDHELKTLTTVMEKLSASTSSTRAYSVPLIYPSGGSSTSTSSISEFFESVVYPIDGSFASTSSSSAYSVPFDSLLDNLFYASTSSTSAYSVPFDYLHGGFSASTSSPPAYSVPPVSFNLLSNGFPVPSTALEPQGNHSLSEIFQCKWAISHGLYCNAWIDGHRDLSSHLRKAHGIFGSNKSRVSCTWADCNRELNKESLLRHVKEAHLGIVYSCDCGKTFSRRDALSAHRRTCTDQQ